MELSDEVLHGLNYLANSSYVSDDNFKKIVNSCLGLLSGEENIERVSTICPEKGEVIKQAYASLLTFTIEIIRNNTEDEIRNLLTGQNFKSDRIDFYVKGLTNCKEEILKSLENCHSGWPTIVDTNWRLDYVIKVNWNWCIMNEVWNSWEVKPPPVCTVKTVVNAKEMANLNQLLFEMCKTLSGMKCLDQEAAILSRYLFKYKRILRHDKGMRNLVQIHQCLKRYLKLNLPQVLTSYKHTLSRNYSSTHAHLPTKQMLKWVLLRLQSFSKIFVRLIELAKASGSFYYGKLLLGWSLTSTFFVFTLTARILTCSKFMVMKAIEWYNSLHRYLPFFKGTAEFMSGYKLPSELKKWLGDVDLAPLKKKTTIDEIFELIDLVKEDDDGDGDGDDDVQVVRRTFLKSLFNSEVIEIDSDVEEIAVEDDRDEKLPPTKSSALILEDVGVPIDVDDEEIQEIGPPRKTFRKDFKRKKMGKWESNSRKHGRGFHR